MKVVVFLGPTLSLGEAQARLKADYLPPVSQGDIVTLLDDPPDVIGIIDGYFERIPAVWHKEILLAMAQGVTLLGASSMGALRAAELCAFGMIGVGEIFERYRLGLLTDDDAVAIQHGPAEYGYEPLSEALVNMQASLERARETGLLSQRSFEVLLATASNTPYWQRSYSRLLADGRTLDVPSDELAALHKMPRVDQKRLDALALLDRIKALKVGARSITINYTTKLEALIERDRCLWRDDDIRVTSDALVNCLRLTGRDYLDLRLRAQATKMRLARLTEKSHGLPQVSEAKVLEFRRRRGLELEANFARWLRLNGQSRSSFREFLRLWLALDCGDAGTRTAERSETAGLNNEDLFLQLRLEGIYPAQLARAIAVERCYAAANPGEDHRLSDETLYRFFCQNVEFDDDLSFAERSADLGFADHASFAFWMTKLYLQHRRATGSQTSTAPVSPRDETDVPL